MTEADRAFLATLADHVTALSVRKVTEDDPHPVTLHLLAQEDGSQLWAIRWIGNVLQKNGDWTLEPSPSNRRKGHAKLYRWTSLERAWKAAVKAQAAIDVAQAERRREIEARRAAKAAASGAS